MTIYYKKVNLNIHQDTFDLDKIKGNKLFEYGNNIGFFKIVDNEYLNNIFSTAFKIPPVKTFLVQAKSQLRPHRDSGSHSCLNYYIKPQGFVTNFWLPKENAKRLTDKRFDVTTNKYVEVELGYNKNDLILVDTFTANKNDAYLLNIGEIHSVEGSIKKEPRTMIQFQWNLNMGELMKKLELG
jgi:hypothetical protein